MFGTGWLAFSVTLAATACALASAPDGDPSDPPIPTGAESALQAARDDLRLRFPDGAIIVRSVDPMEWPDASLGCPAPGRLYAQVVTVGYRIALTTGDHEYAYHSGGSRVVPCASDEDGSGG
ncbi:MAG: hypothetical protein EXR58_00660 [Chloroflexi bacterium]|nr:hypothetical protein [Chloroflexota bacterium]